jgi:5-methylcytosine-specific restriction endonuclease McrA
MKKCSKCDIEKPTSEFYKVNQNKDGLAGFCKSCWKGTVNRDKRNAYEKEYWARPENIDRRKEQVKKSISKNKDHHKIIRNEYLKTDQGINTQRKSGQVTRCKIAGVYVEHVDPLSMYNDQDGICYLCFDKFTFKDMEMDHVIPVSKGGKHEASNVKMSCCKCNRKKGTKIIGVE